MVNWSTSPRFRMCTPRRLSEEARDKARSELAHVARVMSLGTLAASIAHEINQPLSGIVTNASTCQRMLAAAPPNVDGALETARRTIRDANRASEVITRLRALFSRKETATESVDLNEATREVIASVVEWPSEKRGGCAGRTGGEPSARHGRSHPASAGHPELAAKRCGSNEHKSMTVLEVAGHQNRTRSGRTSVALSVKDAGVGFDTSSCGQDFRRRSTQRKLMAWESDCPLAAPLSRLIMAASGRHETMGRDATFSFAIPCALERVDKPRLASTGLIHRRIACMKGRLQHDLSGRAIPKHNGRPAARMPHSFVMACPEGRSRTNVWLCR